MSRILVIDDQLYIRELLSEELTGEGYQVESVGDTRSAWGRLRESPPDLVILDLYLDGFEGWDILNDIKRKAPHLPVLILTAYDSYAEDPRTTQADGYLIKSLEALESLKEKVAKLVG